MRNFTKCTTLGLLLVFYICSGNLHAATSSDLGRILLKNNYSAVTQEFDVYYSNGPTSANTVGGWHPGVDYRASVGTPVYSPVNGVAHSIDRTSYGRLSIRTDDGKYFILLHMSSFNVGVGDPITQGMLVGKSGEVGAAGSPHLHAEYRTSYNAAYYFTSQGNYGRNIDPRLAVTFEVFDFWQARADGVYQASCTEDDNILDAQYKIRNVTNGGVYIEKLALAVHRPDNSYVFDLRVWDANLSIASRSTEHFFRSLGWITELGKYQLVAKALFQGKWQVLDVIPFEVVANPNCGSELSYRGKSDVVFGFLEDNYSQWFPPTVSSRAHSSGSAFYRYYPSTRSYVYAWTDGNLWYKIGSSQWRKSSSIDVWYNYVK